MSFHQWSNEFKKWSDLRDEDIAVFSAAEKRRFNGEAGVLVTTYSMITAGGKRSYDTQQMMDWIDGKERGLIILDEVHVVPAKMFRKVGENIRAHCKLGLTATLLREDDKTTDLNFVIGPKRRNDEGFNAFFYSLVSKDTTEMSYSAKRQAFLVDQGYAFKTITDLAGMEGLPELRCKTSEERRELLAHVML